MISHILYISLLWIKSCINWLRKTRLEPERSDKYRKVNNIKRCSKKAKENWLGEQCSEIEENLRKNNSKRAYQHVKDLTTVKQGKAAIVQDRSGKCLREERRYWTDGQNTALSCTITRQMETHQYWTVPRHIQRTTTPSSQRSGGCSKIIAERELSWSGQHYRRTGPSR